MTSHTECTHPATKQGRSVCRHLSQWLEIARSCGLKIEEMHVGEGGTLLGQWIISDPDSDHASKLIITAGHGLNVTRHVPFVPEAGGKVPIKNVKYWITTIAGLI